MRSIFEASDVLSLLPVVAVVVVVGAIVISAIVAFGGRRVTGRSGDTEAFEAQLEAQIYASRGWDRPEGTPAWDGDNRLGAPETDVAL